MPLHKIPLCSFKYVGDIHSSGTFIYKQEEYISKTKEMFLKSQEKKYIDIEKNKDLNKESNISVYKHQVIPIVLYRQIKINKTINKLLKNMQKNNLIIVNDILLNKFKSWNVNRCTNKTIEKYQDLNIKILDKKYNLKNICNQIYLNNEKSFSFYSNNDIFIKCNNSLLEPKFKNIKIYNKKYKLDRYKTNADIINNNFLSLDRYKTQVYLNDNNLFLNKYKKYIYKNKHNNNLDNWKNFFDVIDYKSMFLDSHKKTMYTSMNENFINQYKKQIYLNQHIEFLTSYKANVYKNEYKHFLNSSYINIGMINSNTHFIENKLKEASIILSNKKVNKEIEKKYKEIYLTNDTNYLNISKINIYLNNNNNFLNLSLKQSLKTKNIETLIKSYTIAEDHKNILFLNKYKKYISFNNNMFIEKSKKKLSTQNNIFLNKTFSNISKPNYLHLNKSYSNIIIDEFDLLQKTFINKQFYKKNNIWLTKEKNIKSINKDDNQSDLESSKTISAKEIYRTDAIKNATFSHKDIIDIKYYKELINSDKQISVTTDKKTSKTIKEISPFDDVLIESMKKDLNKTNTILFDKRKKDIISYKNKIVLNKQYKSITAQNKNKLIGKTYIKTNKDINDKNIKRIKPNNINKKENVLLKHIYINEMCNVKYDSLLEKVMPVAEVFKQDNVFLDKNIMSYTIVKEKGNLLQHVYSNSIFKGTLSMLSHVKNIEMAKETSNHLIKTHKLLNKTYNKSLKKSKTTIHKNKDNSLEVTERWWVLNPTSPFDRKILPFDYDYSKMPLVSNNNIIKTSKVINQHPISFAPYMIDSGNGGNDLNYGTKEIDVSIEIMLDMVNIVGMIVLQDINKFKNCTGQEALEFILELIFDWLNMDSTIRKMNQNNSREHYLRCYRWIRWEAEQLWFEADEDHTIYKNLGIKFAGALLGKLIEYMKYHHFDIVPFWRNLRFMDIERHFNKAKNEDIFKDVDKIKSHRHYMLNTQIQTKQHLFQK